MRNTNGTYFVFSVRQAMTHVVFPLADSTSTRIIGFSIFSVAILALTAGGQLFYLKKFFKSKKLIS
jgi:hypothetical protein